MYTFEKMKKTRFLTFCKILRFFLFKSEAKDRVKERKNLGWDEIDEMIEWLNPEDPKKGLKKGNFLARYLWYSRDNIVRGYFGLPCLLCHDHAVRLNYLVRDPYSFGWDDQRYDLVNNTKQFFEDHLLPSNFHVLGFPPFPEEE